VKQNKVRIIGGSWRGRKITFPDIPGLRPTPDRVRETLFNWLLPIIVGKRCLDLFTGSGALGFEALSRGAKEVVFVDNHREVILSLQQNAELLNCQTQCQFEQINIPQNKIHNTEPFDIIFLDPPFNLDLIQTTIEWLTTNNLTHKHTYLYIEAEKELNLALPNTWQELKNKSAGQVAYYLYQAE